MEVFRTDGRAFVVELAVTRGEDRAAVITRDGVTRVAVADGAGGVGGGAAAAQAVIDAVATWDDPHATIARVDELLVQRGQGQTTAVVVDVEAGGAVRGASAGDSIAWIVDRTGAILELTSAQRRKPLVGDGAELVTFGGHLGAGTTLLVASDGLWKYAKAADLARLVAGEELAAAAKALVALVSTPLQDDVAIVLVR